MTKRHWRRLLAVFGFLVISELAGTLAEPSIRIRTDHHSDWRHGAERARDRSMTGFPCRQVPNPMLYRPATRFHAPLGRLADDDGLPLVGETSRWPAERASYDWTLRALVTPERRRAVAERLRELVPDPADLPEPGREVAAGGASVWIAVEPQTAHIHSSFTGGGERLRFVGQRDQWSVPVSGGSDRAELVTLTEGLVELTIEFDRYALPLASVTHVWHDASTDRMFARNDTTGRGVVVHLPSRVILLRVGEPR